MSRRLVAAAMAAAMLALAPSACDGGQLDAQAHADVDCVHRGAAHRAQHGGLEDDRWHLAHGERVTCDGDEHDARDERREGDGEREDRDRSRERRHDEDRRETPRDGHRGGDDHWHLPGHEGRKHRW